jgi:type III secretory pathway component EscU
MAIAVEDIGVREGMRRVARFIRASLREVAGIFGIVLLLVGITVVVSFLATAGLALIAVVPFVGLAMVPLQLAAWLLRGIAFEYLALTALGAYLTQYRYYLHSLATMRLPETASDVTGPRLA